MQSSFRPDNVDLGTAADRRKELRIIRQMERQELSILPPARERVLARMRMQKTRVDALSIPRVLPTKQHTFQQSWRHRPQTSAVQDKLLLPNVTGERFWVSRWMQVTKQMILPLGEDQRLSPAFLQIKEIIRKMMDRASTMARCGILFDIVSTSSVINTGVPHEIGNAIYEHIDTQYYSLTSIKFVFVGITDNVNCKAARDVFCRDRTVGKEPKGSFETLDNTHMYIVFPGDPRHPGMIDSGEGTDLGRGYNSPSGVLGSTVYREGDQEDFFVTEKEGGETAMK